MALGLLLLTAGCHHSKPRVVIETELGNITAIVEIKKAPLTSMQFLKNVDNGVYENGRASFYRLVQQDNQPSNPIKIQVIQGGVDRETGDTTTPYIPHETTQKTKLKHRNGTLSMARMEPGTANTEFFICIGPQPELDYGGKRNPDGQGFAAFGQVVQGLSVVRSIHRHRAPEQYLDQPIAIRGIRRDENTQKNR